MTARSKVALLAVLLAGCAGTGGAVHFDGRARTMLVRPGEVAEREALPEGYARMGEVSAGCTLVQGRSELAGVLLADVDCSQARLEAALREKVSEVGGALLVGKRCWSHPRRSTSGGHRTLDVRCRAQAARPDPDRLSRRPFDAVHAKPAHDATLRAAEAWNIRLDYTPALARPVSFGARGPDAVRELATVPPSHRRLGDLVARCARGCTERATYSALFVAAGRMGASDLVGVRCIQRDAGWLCTGTAAAYELDPRVHAAAR